MLRAFVILVAFWIAVIHAEKPAFPMNLQGYGIIRGGHATSIAVLHFHCNVGHVATFSI